MKEKTYYGAILFLLDVLLGWFCAILAILMVGCIKLGYYGVAILDGGVIFLILRSSLHRNTKPSYETDPAVVKARENRRLAERQYNASLENWKTIQEKRIQTLFDYADSDISLLEEMPNNSLILEQIDEAREARVELNVIKNSPISMEEKSNRLDEVDKRLTSVRRFINVYKENGLSTATFNEQLEGEAVERRMMED